MVCAECLLYAHKDHHSLESKLEKLTSLAVKKKEEFNKVLGEGGQGREQGTG